VSTPDQKALHSEMIKNPLRSEPCVKLATNLMDRRNYVGAELALWRLQECRSTSASSSEDVELFSALGVLYTKWGIKERAELYEQKAELLKLKLAAPST
jgi:hypothetical protein